MWLLSQDFINQTHSSDLQNNSLLREQSKCLDEYCVFMILKLIKIE